MGTFQATKVMDGFSTVFRQWRAEGTHCRFLHGYGTSVKFWFEGELDERNWTYDFGGFKRSKVLVDGMQPKEWFNWLLDHTTIIAEDDPALPAIQQLADNDVIQLRVIPAVGAEQFAKYIYDKIQPVVDTETNGRVRITQVEFREHEKNTAFYIA